MTLLAQGISIKAKKKMKKVKQGRRRRGIISSGTCGLEKHLCGLCLLDGWLLSGAYYSAAPLFAFYGCHKVTGCRDSGGDGAEEGGWDYLYLPLRIRHTITSSTEW